MSFSRACNLPFNIMNKNVVLAEPMSGACHAVNITKYRDLSFKNKSLLKKTKERNRQGSVE